jgi:hypothetical protein
VKFLEREEEEQIRWGTELSDAVEEFRQGPCKLAGGGRRLPRSHLGHRRLEGERNRHWSERVFEVMPYIAKLDTSDISNAARGGGSDSLRLHNLPSSGQKYPTLSDIKISIFYNTKVSQVRDTRVSY